MTPSRFVTGFAILALAAIGNMKLDEAYARAGDRAAAVRREFSEFPPAVGQWRVTTMQLSGRQLELLDVDDYLRADFTAADGSGTISVYVGYYRNPDRATQHPPTICYPGAGWTKTFEGTAQLPVNGEEGPLAVRETVFEKDPQKILVAYWYSVAGYSGADASWQKVIRLKSLLSGEAVTGALKAQVALPVETTRQEAEERLAGFLREFMPALEAFDPDTGDKGK